NYDLYRDGLKIFTTIDPVMQKYAEQAVIMHMTAMQKNLERRMKKDMWKGQEAILNRAMKDSDRWRNLKEQGLSDNEIRKTFDQPVKMKIFAWNSKREADTTLTPLDSIKYLK